MMRDLRGQGPPGDIGTFQLPCSVIVYQHTFSGTTYIVAARQGPRGWVLVNHGIVAAPVIQSAIGVGGRIFICDGRYLTSTTITGASGIELVFSAGAMIEYSGVGIALDFNGMVEFSLIRPRIKALTGTAIGLWAAWKFEILRPYLEAKIGINFDQGNTGFIGGGGNIDGPTGNLRGAGTRGVVIGKTSYAQLLKIQVNRISGFEAGVEIGGGAGDHFVIELDNCDVPSNKVAVLLHDCISLALRNISFEDQRLCSIQSDNDGTKPLTGVTLENIYFAETHADLTHLIYATRLDGLDIRTYSVPVGWNKPMYIGSRQLYWSGTPTPGVNRLLNGGFEAFTGANPNSWNLDSVVTAKETVEIKERLSSVKITSNGTWARLYQAAVNPANYRGKYMTLGTWIYNLTTNDKTQRLSIDDGVTEDGINIPKANEWRWYTFTRKVGDACAALTADIWANYGGVADVNDLLYADGVRLIEGTFCSPVYAD